MKAFYVDLDHGLTINLVAGPFRSEEVARKYERELLEKTAGADAMSWFTHHGVTGLPAETAKLPGPLNHLLDIDPADLLVISEAVH